MEELYIYCPVFDTFAYVRYRFNFESESSNSIMTLESQRNGASNTALSLFSKMPKPSKRCAARSAGKGGQGGGGRPSNVLQDHFSNSSNSGVKIVGGGGYGR